MGGRGTSSKGGIAGGSLNPQDIFSTTSMVSERERLRKEVDLVLTVLKDVHEEYGVDVEEAQIATLKGRGQSVLGYCDASGNIAINNGFFDNDKMNSVYDQCVDDGFHPSRGNKTALEAVAAHEMGHRITAATGEKLGYGNWSIDITSKIVCEEASRNLGYRGTKQLRSKVSGYGAESNTEAVAEAFADVYCNGEKASRESRAIVDVLNKYAKQ